MADLPVVNAIEELKESNKDQRERLQKSLRAGLLNVVKSVDRLGDIMMRSLNIQQAALDADAMARQRAYEAQLEASRKEKQKGKERESPEKKEEDSPFGLLGIAAVIASIGAGLAAAAVGFVTELTRSIGQIVKGKRLELTKSFGKMYRFLTTGLNDAFKSLGNSIKRIFSSIGKELSKPFKLFEPITKNKFIQNLGKMVTEIADDFKKLFTTVKNLLGFTKEAKSGVSIFSRFFGSFSTVFKALNPIVTIMGTVGRIVGKLFIPFQIFMGAWEAISGFLTGFQETQGDLLDKIIGGLQAGIGGLVNFLIAEPLNLLKSAISWIAGKLGFSEAEALLDQFDFMTDVFQPIIDGFFGIIKDVKKFFEGLLTFDVEMMGDAAGSLTDTILDIIGAPFNLLMDAVGWIAKKFGFEEIGTMFEELDYGSIVKDILAMPYNALKSVGSKIGELFGFGGDEDEEELKKEQEERMSLRRQEAERRKKTLRERVKQSQENVSADTLAQMSPEEAKRRGLIDFADQDDLNDRVEELRMKERINARNMEATQGAEVDMRELITSPKQMTGAEVDVRSREVAAQVAQPNITVAAPQTQIQTDNSTRVNKTSVASASPRRDKTPWWAGRNYAIN